MDKTLNEAGHTLHAALKGEGAKTRVDIKTADSLEGDSDASAKDEFREWAEVMELAQDAVAKLPEGKQERQLGEEAIARLDRELSHQILRAHVDALVRSTCTTPVRASYTVITGDHDNYEAALAAANAISDEDAKDIRLSKSKLREMLKQHYNPSPATLNSAGIEQRHRFIFHSPNLGSVRRGR